jgi:(1->4)-alpha-D-glucan 1-alpha-D-glucosylmutase
MTLPRATYRLQFHSGFTLRDALALVPYFSSLGVSHIYASPLLMARPGSPHGYDTCDPTRVNPEIGAEAGLEALVAALRDHDMGLVLDIVPNHMATARENPWWWDVLRQGRDSPWADFFDIDWDSPDPRLRGKVLLPVLGDELDRVLDRNELTLVCEDNEVTVRYFGNRFPVSPASLQSSSQSLEEAISEVNSSRLMLSRLLDQQHYELAFWRHGDTRLNYRRFFSITHLAGLRVELPKVFALAHARILDWYLRGWLDGLRVDHPDGLRDPRSYLERLQRAAPGAWMILEKILAPGERLPGDWPVAGTTGYDFLSRVTGIFIDPDSEKALTEFYTEFTGEPDAYARLMRAKKRRILQASLAAEVDRLVRLLSSVLLDHETQLAIGANQLREGLIELIACFPVYRTYIQAELGLISDQDHAVVLEAVDRALEEGSQLSPTALEFLDDLLHLRIRGAWATEFVLRFQQLTGPAMAKGIEDTLFYCYSRFIAFNEVGGDPSRFGLSVGDFHAASVQTRQQWPNTMLTTSTHDTKRSEDVRARLALLSEIPERWMAAVRRWSVMNEKYRSHGWPDRNLEYFIYQTLFGSWPLSLDRALACLEKSAREAQQHTNWSRPNANYEAALKHFVTGVLGDRLFLDALDQFVAPLVPAGFINSLAQTLLKLASPGVPDLYQGTELWDLSLVDPDNRRPVDFAQRQQALDDLRSDLQAGKIQRLARELVHNPGDGRIKLFVIHQALQFRRQHPELFAKGSYEALASTGKQAGHVCACARRLGADLAIVVVPRLILGLMDPHNGPTMTSAVWGDSLLILPQTLAGGTFRDLFTGELLSAAAGHEATLPMAKVLGKFPVALLLKKA